MRVLAELAKAAALVERDCRGVVVAHLQGESFAAVTAPVNLRGLQQRPADASSGEPSTDCERVDAHSARPLAQRDQHVTRQFIVDGRSDHGPMGRAQEFAQRAARNPVALERLVLKPGNRFEIARTSFANQDTLTPVAHVETIGSPLAPPRWNKSSAQLARRACRLRQRRYAA